MKKYDQPFHLVTYSPWPLLVSFSVFIEFVGLMNFLNNYELSLMFLGFLLLLICMFQWWRDVVREGTYQGFHTSNVVKGLKMGMIMFIISEVFFFISIFWCYFHMFLSPSIELGGNWPPKNIIIFNPFLVPMMNTIILLSSGVTVTVCHYSILLKKKNYMLLFMEMTLLLGVMFTFLQYFEYKEASFTIADSVFGAIFFMATGFHGLHVIIGSLFLLINYFRMQMMNFSSFHHFGFEAVAWYWHFVDVVWLFLYMLMYYWIY